MTKQRLEQLLYLFAAVVCAAAPFALSPIAAGLLLAAINLAFALCICRSKR